MNILRLKNEVSPLFARHPAIEAAYLFGSIVHGQARAASDVDIAIRLLPDSTAQLGFNLRLNLMEELERHFTRPVDILILNNASLKMIRQVLSRGELLFARDEGAERLYAIQKQKSYFDFKYYIEKDREELKSFFGVA
jgi:predicted nucleotidyltransferase